MTTDDFSGFGWFFGVEIFFFVPHIFDSSIENIGMRMRVKYGIMRMHQLWSNLINYTNIYSLWNFLVYISEHTQEVLFDKKNTYDLISRARESEDKLTKILA